MCVCVCLCVCVTGNTLCYLVLRHAQNVQLCRTARFYLLLLCTLNTCYLLISLAEWALSDLILALPLHDSTATYHQVNSLAVCTTLKYVKYTVVTALVYNMLLFNLNRYRVLYQPFNLATSGHSSLTRAKVLCSMISILSVLGHLNKIVYYDEVVTSEGDRHCVRSREGYIVSIIDMVMLPCLPTALTTILNICVVVKLVQISRDRRKLVAMPPAGQAAAFQSSVMAPLFVCSAHNILLMPRMVCIVINLIGKLSFSDIDHDPYATLSSISFALGLTGSGLYCFALCLVGRVFRKALVKMCTCHCPCSLVRLSHTRGTEQTIDIHVS